MKIGSFFLWVVFMFSGTLVAEAVTHYVDPSNNHPASPYTSWRDAARSIQPAIDASTKDDVVEVASGTYALSSPLVLKQGITVKASTLARVTIDGQGTTRCFELDPSSGKVTTPTVLEDLTIINGFTANDGGAVYCGQYGILTIEHCTLRNNEADGKGGAVYGEHITAIHSDFRNNESTGNGGAMAEGVAQFCHFHENQSHSSGGGIRNIIADSCIIAENQAYIGGGASGGQVHNCTIVNNTASSRGGGVDYVGNAKNCILWYNTAPLGTNLNSTTTTYSCSPDLTHGVSGCITNKPQLIDVQGGNYHLFRTSPCLNIGNNADVSTTEDIEGNERIYRAASGGIVDLGAYEVCGHQVVTFYVNKNNPTPAYPYTAPTTASTNIQTAIDITEGGDSVAVAYAHYDLPDTIFISTRISLIGTENHGEKPIIDANDQFRCLRIYPGGSNSVVQSFVFTHGESDYHEAGGGAAYSPLYTIFSDCDFSHNNAYDKGGALYFSGIAINCRFLLNTASSGGGTYSGTASNCLYSGNIAAYKRGGGACCSSLINCTLTNNTAQGLYPDGGGADGGTAQGCLFVGNTAEGNGGGMYLGTAKNCIIRSNKAFRFGGGTSSTDVFNSLIVENSSRDGGGGCYHGLIYNSTIVKNLSGAGGGTYQGTLFNTIVSENTSTNHSIQNAYNPSAANSVCAEDGVAQGVDGCITNAPSFIDAVAGNFHLRIDSPCIDTGANAYTNSPTDLDGNPRVMHTTVDMGAYEFAPQVGADTDMDHMPDSWEYDQFDGNADPAADADGDLFNNLGEYLANTDPNDPSAFLRITSSSITNNGAQMTISWTPSVAGRIYGVSSTTNLTEGFSDQGISLPYPANSATVTNAAPNAYYKINVRLN